MHPQDSLIAIRVGTSSVQVEEFLREHGYREGRHEDLNVEFVPAAAASANGR